MSTGYSLLAVAAWLPWAVIAAILLTALGVLAWLARALPRQAVHVPSRADGPRSSTAWCSGTARPTEETHRT